MSQPIITEPDALRRLFVAVMPCGVSYCDTECEEHGDYKRLAFLPFKSLAIEWHANVPAPFKALIESDASKIIARRGKKFQVSASGQTVTLGE